MRIITTPLVIATLTLILAAPAYGFGSMIAVGLNEAAELDAAATPFRAEARLETAEQNIDTIIYYKPGHVRDEITMGSQSMVLLQDLGTEKMYMLMPQGMYMEFDRGESNEQIQEYKLIEREVVGKEEVNGFDTTKYKVIYEGPDGKYGGFSWFTDDNIVVKAFMVTETGGEKERVRFQVNKLERGEQPDALFVIPSNYRKFDMGGMGMMKNAMGGMGAQQPGAADGEGTGLADQMTDAAKEGAEEAAKQEAKQTAKEKVSKGLRRLFGRD